MNLPFFKPSKLNVPFSLALVKVFSVESLAFKTTTDVLVNFSFDAVSIAAPFIL